MREGRGAVGAKWVAEQRGVLRGSNKLSTSVDKPRKEIPPRPDNSAREYWEHKKGVGGEVAKRNLRADMTRRVEERSAAEEKYGDEAS